MNGIKLGFSTLPCMELNGDELSKYCIKFGLAGVEIRVDNNGGICGCVSEKEFETLRETFAKNKVTITNLGTSVRLKSYEKEQIEKAKALVDKAKTLNTKAIRIFLGNFMQKFSDPIKSISHEGIVKALKEMCAYASEKNVEIWIETHNEYSTGKVLSKLLNEVDCDNLKIIWDIIHPIEDGESVEETWKYIGEKIAHVHIKDGKKRDDPSWHDYEYTLLGEGDLPIERIIKMLKKEGFEGYLSLEWENVWRSELIAYPKDMDYILSMFKDAVYKA